VNRIQESDVVHDIAWNGSLQELHLAKNNQWYKDSDTDSVSVWYRVFCAAKKLTELKFAIINRVLPKMTSYLVMQTYKSA